MYAFTIEKVDPFITKKAHQISVTWAHTLLFLGNTLEIIEGGGVNLSSFDWISLASYCSCTTCFCHPDPGQQDLEMVGEVHGVAQRGTDFPIIKASCAANHESSSSSSYFIYSYNSFPGKIFYTLKKKKFMTFGKCLSGFFLLVMPVKILTSGKHHSFAQMFLLVMMLQ